MSYAVNNLITSYPIYLFRCLACNDCFKVPSHCRNFQLSILDEKNHKKILEIVEKQRKKADVLPDAVMSVELDNSRAGLKIFSDLRYYSPVSKSFTLVEIHITFIKSNVDET